jgi:hypothetical protein
MFALVMLFPVSTAELASNDLLAAVLSLSGVVLMGAVLRAHWLRLHRGAPTTSLGLLKAEATAPTA